MTPIGQAQKAVQVESMARVIEGVERLSAFDRALLGIVDAEAAVREIADIYNAPWTCCRPRKRWRRCAGGRPRQRRRSRRRAWVPSRPGR